MSYYKISYSPRGELWVFPRRKLPNSVIQALKEGEFEYDPDAVAYHGRQHIKQVRAALRSWVALDSARQKNYYERRVTLCESCRKATNSGCSWSREFKPVQGWDAQETVCGYQISRATEEEIKTPIQSYVVKHCPEFVFG